MKKVYKHIKIYSLVLIFAYVLVLVINKTFNQNFNDFMYLTTLVNVISYTTSVYLANVFFVGLFFNKVSISNQNFKFAIGYWISILSAFVMTLLLEFFGRMIIYDSSVADILNLVFSVQQWPQHILTFIITTVVYFFLVYKKKQENKVREQKIVARVASAKFESLKSQIDPHFLFNSLNVLSSLIEENPEKAQQFTIALSKTYRYVLEQRTKDLVSLEEEIAFAKTFIKLLKLRFEDALEIKLPQHNIDPDYKVVPLVLQLLLENAVKHNRIDSQQKLIIEIEVRDDVLVVKNNLQPKSILKNESTGFGLHHIIEQYNLVTDRKVLILENNTCFVVYLPILTQQIITEVNMDLEHNTDEIILKRAKYRLKELKEFYTSIVIFVFFTLLYFVFKTFDFANPIRYWMPMGIVIYAFVLLTQAASIFGLKKWEQKMMNKLIKQYKNK